MRSGAAPREQQMRDAVRERVRLAGAGAGEDQQRPVAEGRGLALPGIQLVACAVSATIGEILYIHP